MGYEGRSMLGVRMRGVGWGADGVGVVVRSCSDENRYDSEKRP